MKGGVQYTVTTDAISRFGTGKITTDGDGWMII